MRAVLRVSSWTRAWGLTLLSLGISYNFPAQAQQNPITDAAAQVGAPQSRPHKHHHYQLVQIPTLGGPGTNFFDNTNNIAVLNARGVVSGGAADTKIPDPYAPAYWWSNGNITHAFRWQNGTLTNLGALPGTNNSGSAWISANGLIAGLSENGQIDPSVKDLPEISAVMWRDGKIINLGSLPAGGYQSAAVSVNNRGEVVGVASNLVRDSNSLLQYNPNLWSGVPYGYQLRAFIWDQEGGMQDLGTLGTGTDAQAIRINERGQIIGDSYISSDPGVCFGVATGAFVWDHEHGMVDLGGFGGTCTLAFDLNNRGHAVGASLVSGDTYQRAFLWQKGSLRDLGGSLGGNNTGAFAINENGESVGFANLPGESTFHATLWKHVGEMTDLGTVGSDPCSFAQGVNDESQVVGNSSPGDCVNFDTSRAFLWERGSIVDLNTLVPRNSPLYLLYAYTINNRGEIAVNGRDAHGIEQAALLIPCDEDHADVVGCDYGMVDEPAAATLSNSTAVTDGLAAATSTQQLTAGEGVAARGTRMLRLPNIPRAAIHAGVSPVGNVTVSDSQAPAVQKLTITSGTPPQGTVGKAYDVHCHIPFCGGSIVVGFRLDASGGVPPYSWIWTPQPGSSLPPSLSIRHPFGIHGCVSLANSGYGICGTPTHAGSYNVTVKVTDSASPPAHAIANYIMDID